MTIKIVIRLTVDTKFEHRLLVTNETSRHRGWFRVNKYQFNFM